MVNEIEIVLRKYEFDIRANSIQVYNVSENNYGIEVLIYFKDFIEEFSVNINIEI
jgi:galactitol-specific phosphotransferase system IIB component